MQNTFTTPVLLIAFNRPDTFRRVFDMVRKVRPASLYIAIDGPRPERPQDAALCGRCRAIAEQIDWDCNVHTLFRDKNIGCGFGPSEAILWAFKTAEELIILEDDIVPSLSFFRYCEDLLHRYRDDKRIGIISGLSIHSKEKKLWKGADYTFSHFGPTWGWATWRDRWALFDIYMKDFPLFLSEGGSYNIFMQKKMSEDMDRRMKKTYDDIDRVVTHAWDYQWVYTRIKNGWLDIVPGINMITNIGADNGTHSSAECYAKPTSTGLEASELAFPLKHPHFVVCNTAYDRYYYDSIHPTRCRRLAYYMRHPYKLWMRLRLTKIYRHFSGLRASVGK